MYVMDSSGGFDTAMSVTPADGGLGLRGLSEGANARQEVLKTLKSGLRCQSMEKNSVRGSDAFHGVAKM